jgi:hypothetical protein
MHLVNESLHGPGYEQFSEQYQNFSFVRRVLSTGRGALVGVDAEVGSAAEVMLCSESLAKEASCCLEIPVEAP